jgi:hypothetical protein
MNDNLFERRTMILIVMIVVAATVMLAIQGRVVWCESGDLWPWSWATMSRHNSQHVLDAYSFTHILHGMLEFWLIGLVFRRVPLAWRFVIAIFIESTWEVVENTDYVINRYREATISLDYFGDSIINSLADIVFCGVGFVISRALGFWKSLAVFVATETVLLFTIRDSLILNIIMLVYPLDAIKKWQGGL